MNSLSATPLRDALRISPPLLIVATVLSSGCCTTLPEKQREEARIQSVLETQIREWNNGNLAGFMETYARSETTRFASGGNLQRGWQAVYDRYRASYPDRATMGQVTFSKIEVDRLSPDAAIAFGEWRLDREKGDAPHGLFTLLLRKQGGHWRIVHDHTSSAAPK